MASSTSASDDETPSVASMLAPVAAAMGGAPEPSELATKDAMFGALEEKLHDATRAHD